MKLTDCKPGQPVEMIATHGAIRKLLGHVGYLMSPTPDEYGLHLIAFLVKPATKTRNAETRLLKVVESSVKVREDEKPPRNFQWFFTAKNYRYSALPSGEQPQQLD